MDLDRIPDAHGVCGEPVLIYLKSVETGKPRRTSFEGKRGHVLHIDDDTVTGDKRYGERDPGIFHPEGMARLKFEYEEHAAIFGKRIPEHQSPCTLLGGAADLHGEGIVADDHQGCGGLRGEGPVALLCWPLFRFAGEEDQDHRDKKGSGCPHLPLFQFILIEDERLENEDFRIRFLVGI